MSMFKIIFSRLCRVSMQPILYHCMHALLGVHLVYTVNSWSRFHLLIIKSETACCMHACRFILSIYSYILCCLLIVNFKLLNTVRYLM